MTYTTRHGSKPRAGQGWTIVEMMVVTLVMAVLMALVLPLFVSARREAERRQCRANMVTIANAEAEYKAKDAGVIGHTPQYADEMDHLRLKVNVPVTCPTGGTYSLSSTDWTKGFTVHCSDSTHDVGYGTDPAGYTPGKNKL